MMTKEGVSRWPKQKGRRLGPPPNLFAGKRLALCPINRGSSRSFRRSHSTVMT
jgi:hypothetical protein